MANPAPTINQINAFNATQGTTIDFNIIGGTELVRSNKIYIYDLSDNSLICTHLYVSTESIHELPPNTDGSIVYESGKSSANFVNGAQYYAQIQTYTDTAGTEGGSGLSVAKMFWCLVNPTLTITTIPSTISTTSYNISATYNANTSVVSNIIQQYQFNLYSATGSLLQSSGVIVGNGEQQGTSTAYDISYNFTGLSVGSSYYVTVEVTTTQGMSVNAQSSTFTVSIDTPTLGEATVVNNACDGYISVTSNLSGEYGGSASGEIASFVTNSINNVSSLKVSLEPIQDLSHGDPSPSNICPITGWTGCEVDVAGVNVWDEETEQGTLSWTTGKKTYAGNAFRTKNYVPCVENKTYYVSAPVKSTTYLRFCFYDAQKQFLSATSWKDGGTTITTPVGCHFIMFAVVDGTTYQNNISINYPSTDTTYHAYNGTTYPISWQTEAGTVYGGTVDLVSGELVVDRAMVDLGTLNYSYYGNGIFYSNLTGRAPGGQNILCSLYPTSDTQSWSSIEDKSVVGNIANGYIYIRDTDYSDVTAFKQAMQGVQLVYELATPTTYSLTPHQIQTLVGQNNVWSDAGDVEVTFNLPISNLLVKRQDASDVSGNWLTLYSQPITQASDMDFTFIDFLNQYGKTYKYALVPLLTQTQSGVEVEVEGGYTVSDEVQSIFDGVFIADSTGSQKCKANVGYGNVDMNQVVGSITPIGAQYPVVITNSKNQYHNGSISGTIVPDDYYFNGNLSRIDMVNKRDELEQFLTNKRAKIIKDWNGKIWLVMIMDNVSCTFNNNYGMGIVNFSTNWIEVGDPTNQQDLQATGLINVGGV